MNRMFRFNIRKSHHRVDSILGVRSSLTTRGDDDNNNNNNKNETMVERENQRSSNRSCRGVGNRSKRSLISINKMSSVRVTKSEPSQTEAFDVYNNCDSSETEELTVPHVDSALSQTTVGSDTETYPITITVTDSSTTSYTAVVYDSSDIDDDDVLFLGNVFEYDENDGDTSASTAPTPPLLRSHRDDPIVQLALETSQHVLDSHDATQVDFTVSALGILTHDKKNIEPLYVNLDQMGNKLVERGDSDQAVIKYIQALYYKREALSMYQHSTYHTSEQNRTHVLASIATSINNLAFLQHNQCRIDATVTLELYLVALQIKRHVLGCDHLSVGKTLNNIGSIHYIQSDFQKAAETYEQAREILQLHLGRHHLDVCTVTANIGDVHVSMKQWTLAVKEYRTALELRWPLFGPSDSKVIRLMEQIAELEMLINQLNAQMEDAQEDKCNNERFYGPIVKDVRKLQKEVQRDIDHLDIILSSQLPLELMKDKITVYRELRDMMNGDCGDDGTHDVTDDTHLLSEDDTTVVVVGCDNVDHTASPKSYHVDTKNTVATTNSIQVVVVSEIPPLTPTIAMTTTRRFRNQESTSSPTTTTNGIPKKSSPQLTSEERKNALLSVKEKLSKLRSNRELLSSSSSPIIMI